MITVIKKKLKKKKRRKKTRKKKRIRRDSILGPLLQYYILTTRPGGLSHLYAAKSFNLNKTDVIITVNTSTVV